jgi:hypothetical protein
VTVREEEELEKTLEAAQVDEENEHSEEYIITFSQEEEGEDEHSKECIRVLFTSCLSCLKYTDKKYTLIHAKWYQSLFLVCIFQAREARGKEYSDMSQVVSEWEIHLYIFQVKEDRVVKDSVKIYLQVGNDQGGSQEDCK